MALEIQGYTRFCQPEETFRYKKPYIFLSLLSGIDFLKLDVGELKLLTENEMCLNSINDMQRTLQEVIGYTGKDTAEILLTSKEKLVVYKASSNTIYLVG